MRFWIGTSGFSYPTWVGAFYPPGTKSNHMLAYYRRQFPLVEINQTYYQMPTAERMANLVRRTPKSFQFYVKYHQSTTHGYDLATLPVFLGAMTPFQEAKKLLGLLAQFPQSFHRTKANEGYLTSVLRGSRDHHVAVEFRHASWDHADVNRLLADECASLVSVDVPEVRSLYPRKLVATGPEVYVRFHSRNADKWYGGGHERYDYDYSEAQLEDWVQQIAGLMSEVSVVRLLFNNCMHAQAAENARQVEAIVERILGPDAVVKPERAETDMVQGELF